METDLMRSYIQHIGNYPLITTEQEKSLARRIQQGDEEARRQLIRANLRLVVKIAHDFKGRGLPLRDLISEGNIGLMRAADKFTPDKGVKFSTYGAWWIKQAMRRGLTEKSETIRFPVPSAGNIHKTRYFMQKLTSIEQNILVMRFGLNRHSPKTLEEVSRQVGQTREQIQQIQKKALKKLRDTIAR